MRIADVKGQKCPAPLIATRKLLNELKSGEVFKVITDSRNAADNISRFLKDTKTAFSIDENGGIWTLRITKS